MGRDSSFITCTSLYLVKVEWFDATLVTKVWYADSQSGSRLLICEKSIGCTNAEEFILCTNNKTAPLGMNAARFNRHLTHDVEHYPLWPERLPTRLRSECSLSLLRQVFPSRFHSSLNACINTKTTSWSSESHNNQIASLQVNKESQPHASVTPRVIASAKVQALATDSLSWVSSCENLFLQFSIQQEEIRPINWG